MKNKFFKYAFILFTLFTFTNCDSDDDGINFEPTGESKTYMLMSVDDPNISGTATFIENDNNSTTIELQLNGTPDGGMHPAHIHFNTAAESGEIALTLGTVSGATGFSSITTSDLDDGTDITYDELLNFDGYINVHLSSDDLGTLVAQGDIGQNELTGENIVFGLGTVDLPSVVGIATFEKRVNGEALASINLDFTPDGGMHPAHIHSNTAAEGGDIVFTFNPVNGTNGESKTNVDTITYAEILNYDGYINVHLSSDDLGTLVAQGDIGQNAFTGESKSYALYERDVEGIGGTVTFQERENGEALATIILANTPDGGMHPAHIHINTAAEGGDIIFTFNAVDGSTGLSKTNVDTISYVDILTYDGYINVHLSSDDLGTLVAQGDIGQNELTGNTKTYNLNSVDVPTISGTVTFNERLNGEALAILDIDGTPNGGVHPTHIHAGSVATAPGNIIFTFNSVNGTTGMSKTNVSTLDDSSTFGYTDILTVDGYINVHLSATELGTIVAQGNVGQNE